MAAGPTYESIATTTLGSAAASITFSSIPSTYTDLRIVLVGSDSSIAANPYLRFNGSTSLYSQTVLGGSNNIAYSTSYASNAFIYLLATNNPPASTTMQFYTVDVFSYAGSTYKTVLTTTSMDANGNTQSTIERSVGLFRSTSAITSLELNSSAGTWNIGTTATIWGIKAA